MSGNSGPQPPAETAQPSWLNDMVRIGGDRAIIGPTNWSAMSHQQLYDAVVTNNDPAAVMDVSDKWVSLGNNMLDSANTLHQRVTSTASGWSGEAAESSRAAVTQLVDWGGKASQTAQFMGTQLSQQSQVMATAKANMPQPVQVPPVGVSTEPGLAGLNASLVDGAAAQQAADEVHARAIDVATSMEQDSVHLDSAIPEFEPVPMVVKQHAVPAGPREVMGTPQQPGLTPETPLTPLSPLQQGTPIPGASTPATPGQPAFTDKIQGQSPAGVPEGTSPAGYQPPALTGPGQTGPGQTGPGGFGPAGVNGYPGGGPAGTGPSGGQPFGSGPLPQTGGPGGQTTISGFPEPYTGPGPEISHTGSPYGTGPGSQPSWPGEEPGPQPGGINYPGSSPFPGGETMPFTGGGGGPSGSLTGSGSPSGGKGFGGAGGTGAGDGLADPYKSGSISSRLGAAGTGAAGTSAAGGQRAASAAAGAEEEMGGPGGAGAAGAAKGGTGEPGMSGMGKGGKKEDDKEHKSAGYLRGDDIFEPMGGELPPPVIGERRARRRS